MSKNLFFDLPQELIKHIYEFDPTYRGRYIDVLDSIPLVSRIQPFPGNERWIYVLVTKQHSPSPSLKETLKYYRNQRDEDKYRLFACILETRRDAILEKTLTKAIFSFRKKFKL